MKKFRNRIALLLCAALLCGTSVPAAAAEGEVLEEVSIVSAEQTESIAVPEEIPEEEPAVQDQETAVQDQETAVQIQDPAVQDQEGIAEDTAGTEEQAEAGDQNTAGTKEQAEAGDQNADVTEEPAETGEQTAAKPEAEESEEQTAAEPKAEESDEQEEAAEAEEEEELETAKNIAVEYQTHVQTYGWEEDWKTDGEMSGTSGESKRLEGIRIRLDGAEEDDYIEYRTHVQTYGWETEWKRNGDMSGTSGESKRLEGIQIRLSPSLEESYDIYYCVHAQTYGWLGWAKNGLSAGTEGLSKRLEGIRIVIVPKGEAAPDPVGDREEPFIGFMFQYQTHVQTYGWQDWVGDGQTSGTFGESKRLEGIRIQLDPNTMAEGAEGGVEYRTHVQTYGWEKEWKKDGEMSGTSGESKRLEAIEIRLTGELAEKYDIYYRVHAQTYGWLDWAKNGESAGTEGMSKRLEAIQIIPILKGDPAPGSTFAPLRKAMSSFTVPYAQPTAGTNTIRNLLRTALVPCGRTLYQWGGGHGPDTNLEGMPQQWVDFFESHSAADFEPDYTYITYWNGVDCSGYSSWVLANTTGNRAGSAILAQSVAQAYTANKWTTMLGKENKTFLPGDFVSVLYGHIWISLGQCSDGSTLLIHSAGNGIQLSGTGGKAMEMASYYMQKYFPYWPYRVSDYEWLLDEDSYTARWITNGTGLLTDPDGMQKMSAEQVMQVLLGD